MVKMFKDMSINKTSRSKQGRKIKKVTILTTTLISIRLVIMISMNLIMKIQWENEFIGIVSRSRGR